MKVGTDGVLLGAWANVEDVNSILDIGTGSALIAIMLAQRSKAKITAIEIDKDAFLQAKENIQNCKWHERIKVENISMQDYVAQTINKFDLIVCNPPFFENSLLNPNEKKSLARHSIALSFDELIEGSLKLLNQTGSLSLIIPYQEFESFSQKVTLKGLFLNKIFKIKPNEDKGIKRVICEFGRIKKPFTETLLAIEKGERHIYTNEYISLTKDFYLKF